MTHPAGAGVRLLWAELPPAIRARVEHELDARVVEAVSATGGFSPGVASRLRTAKGGEAFLKAVSDDPNPDSPRMHRREARIASVLPRDATLPSLRCSFDEDGWVVLIFDAIAGAQPPLPWRSRDLEAVVEAVDSLHERLTPPPIPPELATTIGRWGPFRENFWAALAATDNPALDAWSRRHAPAFAELSAGAAAAAAGDTLLHLDLRADNILVTADGAVVVDWPHARPGAPWVDFTGFAPSVAMQGGPLPERLFAMSRTARAVPSDALTPVVAAVAGFFTWHAIQPAPPGLPTLRPFQEAQAAVARAWLARLTGLR